MGTEILVRKLDRVRELLIELERQLAVPFETFVANLDLVRATERNFELMIESASDISNEISFAKSLSVPDTYRESFMNTEKAGLVSAEIANLLAEGARIRNILVHEYDFEEDYEKFYVSVKRILPAYREYALAVFSFIGVQGK